MAQLFHRRLRFSLRQATKRRESKASKDSLVKKASSRDLVLRDWECAMSAYSILIRSQVLKLQLTYLIQVTSNQIIGRAAIDSRTFRTQSSRVTQHGVELSSTIMCGAKNPPSQFGTSTLVSGGSCSNQFFSFRVRLIKRFANQNYSSLSIFLKVASFGSLSVYMLLFLMTSKMDFSSRGSSLLESRLRGALSLLAMSTDERFLESFWTSSSWAQGTASGLFSFSFSLYLSFYLKCFFFVPPQSWILMPSDSYLHSENALRAFQKNLSFSFSSLFAFIMKSEIFRLARAFLKEAYGFKDLNIRDYIIRKVKHDFRGTKGSIEGGSKELQIVRRQKYIQNAYFDKQLVLVVLHLMKEDQLLGRVPEQLASLRTKASTLPRPSPQLLKCEQQMMVLLSQSQAVSTGFEISCRFIRSRLLDCLIDLLDYSNIDLSIKALSIIYDVFQLLKEKQPNILDVLVAHQFVPKALAVAKSADESRPEEASAVFSFLDVLSLMVRANSVKQMQESCEWMIERIGRGPQDENQLYAMQILLALSGKSQHAQMLVQKGLVLTVFEMMNKCKTPLNSDHHETLLVGVQILDTLTLYPDCLPAFQKLQAGHLLIKIIRAKGVLAKPVLQLLDVLIKETIIVADEVVAAMGLGIIGPLVLGKGLKVREEERVRMRESVSGVVAGLLLRTGKEGRRRTVNKITDNNLQKVHKIVQWAQQILNQTDTPDSQEAYVEALKEGLGIVENCGVLLGVLAREFRVREFQPTRRVCEQALRTRVRWCGDRGFNSLIKQLILDK